MVERTSLKSEKWRLEILCTRVVHNNCLGLPCFHLFSKQSPESTLDCKVFVCFQSLFTMYLAIII